jgi:ABC-type multidrug transport system fused ATPase/permease subunit
MAIMMICHIVLAACSIGFVYSCKKLVDSAVATYAGTSSSVDIAYWFAALAAIVCARIGLNALRSYIQTKTEIRIKNNLRRNLFDILLRMQSDGGRTFHSGDLLNRIQEDVRVVSSTLSGSIPNLIGTALQFVAALGFLIYLDLRLAIVVGIVVPACMVVGKYISAKIRKLTLDIRNRDSKVQEHIQESIQHLTLLQSLEHSQSSASELDELQGSLYVTEMRRTKFGVISRIFISAAFQAGYIIAFMWGVLGISKGTVTYGMMTAFLQLVGQIQRPLLEMSSQIPTIIHSTASIDRIMEIEALPQESAEDSILIPGTAGILLENVTFAYPGGDRNVLDGFSHDFKPGSRTSIVGPTGIGKSTLIRLLLALLKPQSGNITIYSNKSGDCGVSKSNKCDAPKSADCDARGIIPVTSATRCNLVYVPQGNSLFSGTIRDNLLMGNPEATEQQMRDALHVAAADFVLELPSGLDSQCFESGAGLSEGQAQRIAIARALLRPGSILLLDEFSSALDAETETSLMERLTGSLPDHTMIFITHREKIIEYCDSVLRLG